MNGANPDRGFPSVGKQCFVKYFYGFLKESQTDDVVELMSRKEHCTEKSCRSRTFHARRISRAGRARNALREISRSRQVPESVRDQAAPASDDARPRFAA